MLKKELEEKLTKALKDNVRIMKKNDRLSLRNLFLKTFAERKSLVVSEMQGELKVKTAECSLIESINDEHQKNKFDSDRNNNKLCGRIEELECNLSLSRAVNELQVTTINMLKGDYANDIHKLISKL